jgi:hypothetical protein
MNKHFEDAQYYLKRAGETAAKGIGEEVGSIRERFQALVGGDEEPEAGRLDEFRADLDELIERAEGQTRERLEEARERIDEYRGRKPAE